MKAQKNTATSMGGPRYRHIDIARGVCILLVALGHNPLLVSPESAFGQVLGVFRMPLLFFIAGTLFKPGQSLRELARHKADALIKPFVVMALLHAPLRLLFWHADPLAYGLGLLSGSGAYLPWLYALWFLPHLWLLFVAAWGLLRLFEHYRLSTPARLLVIAVLPWLGSLAMPLWWNVPAHAMGEAFVLKGLPLSADILPISGFFFMLGHMTRCQTHAIELRWAPAVLSLVALAAVMITFQPVVSLFDRRYAAPIGCTLGALCGIALVMYLSKLINQFEWPARALAFCGFNSLFVLIFHSPIQSTVVNQLNRLWPSHALWAGLIGLGVCIGASLVLAQTIRQHHWLRALFLPIKDSATERLPKSAPPRLSPALPHPTEVVDDEAPLHGLR